MLHGLSEVPNPLEKLVAWERVHPSIRAMILTSSRERPGGPVDLLSDYDLILAVTEIGQFERDDVWILNYGQPMVHWGDQGEIDQLTRYSRG